MPDIGLWHRCNSHCIMCTNMDTFIRATDRHYDLAAQMRKLRRFAATRDAKVYARNGDQTNYVLFTGGEPTLHPQFLRLMMEFRKALPQLPFCLLTNGRTLAYPSFARCLLAVVGAPFSAAVPVHGHDAATHDAVTRSPGSFSQTLEGLGNLFRFRRPGQEIEIRVILHKRTARHLERTLEFVLETFPDTRLYRLSLIHFEMEGQAEKNFERIGLSLADCVARVELSLPALLRFGDFRLYHFPLCVLPQALRSRAWRTLPKSDIRFLRKCGSCGAKGSCPGVQRWYPARYGISEFAPIQTA